MRRLKTTAFRKNCKVKSETSGRYTHFTALGDRIARCVSCPYLEASSFGEQDFELIPNSLLTWSS